MGTQKVIEAIMGKLLALNWWGVMILLLIGCNDAAPTVIVPTTAPSVDPTMSPATETILPTATGTTSATAIATVTPIPTGTATQIVHPSVAAITPGDAVPTATPQPASPALPPGSAVDAAIQDLARRTNVAPAAVEVVEVVGDEFPAGDLGCPSAEQPARPIPALVTGQRITLTVSDTGYVYHAHGPQIVFCGRLR